MGILDSSSGSKIRQILKTISIFWNGVVVGIVGFAYWANSVGLLMLTPKIIFLLLVYSAVAITVLSLPFWIDELASAVGKIRSAGNRTRLFENDTRIKHKEL